MQSYIGLMSGTSLDGVDAALVSFENDIATILNTFFIPYPEDLKLAILEMHNPSFDELERSQCLSIQLTHLYAKAVGGLFLHHDRHNTQNIRAIGCHGQTLRHRPDLEFTLQLNNPALLAELTGITVVADFRSRDIAAGGQGAPLVPAFHHATFQHPSIHRVIVNIGGISNLTDLNPQRPVTGFDCGPGNILLDAWCEKHTGQAYDKDGAWSTQGWVNEAFLTVLMQHPFFNAYPPKSTGRETFNINWLESLTPDDLSPVDVQATLLELSARCIADDIEKHCVGATEVYLCGGGAHNIALKSRLSQLLPKMTLALTESLGIPANWVEAVAFAWLAKQSLLGLPGNLPEVTGARGPRVLGAIYAA